MTQGSDQPESVHHCRLSLKQTSALMDRTLLADTALTQTVVSLGRAARNKFSLKVRQPLRKILVRPPSKADEEALRRVEAQVLSELNVKGMEVTSDVGDLISYVIKPNLPVLGSEIRKAIRRDTCLLSAAEPAAIAAQVEAEQPVKVYLDGGDEPCRATAR